MNKMEQTHGEEIDLEERKKKLISFFKNKQVWVIGILIIALVLGVYIRSMPMFDHGGNPGLWDITTNTWTLGPDLDPWLFTRYAKTIVEEGSLPAVDMFRNVPLGFETSRESMLLPYMIAWTYYLLDAIDVVPNVIYAAVIFPVIMFALTIIAFFLFVREIFVRKSKESVIKANIISLIATFFMIVIPSFLSRTVAGIPEKESAAFFFVFISLFLFLKAWKSEKLKPSIIYACLAGISTAALGLIWGGSMFVFITVGIAGVIAFLFNKVDKKEILIYLIWVVISFSGILIFSSRFTLKALLTSLSTAPAVIAVIIFLTHLLLWNTKLSKLRILKKYNLPRTVVSIIVSVILIILVASILFGPSFILDQAKSLNEKIFKPIQGRWNTTVAENRQPYYKEWVQSFGPFVKKVAIFFWMFFIGAAVLFKKTFSKIKKKDSWILTGVFVLFLLGMVFSRYAENSLFNGDNFISKTFYYLTALGFICYSVYYFLEYSKRGDESFKKIDYEFILLIVLFLLAVFSARGAIRLVMVLAVIAPIFVSFLIVEIGSRFFKAKDETRKFALGIFIIILIIASIFTFNAYYKTVKAQAFSFVPGQYNQQWQKAMEWVRNETPENAVFGHWWDYGYWVQSIGNRATVVDGGNAITYWNYLMGRYVLTGDNQADALEFLYNHNTTHLLIDSTDIGKYGAYSQIGSDEKFDRLSWFGTFVNDPSQTQETNNRTLYVYTGGVALDEDLIYNESGKEIMLPARTTGIGAIIIPVITTEQGSEFQQPYVIMVYNNKQYNINLRYLEVAEQFVDFGEGIEAAVKVIPSISQTSSGTVNQNPIGAAIFISKRHMRGLFSQIYLLNDPFNNFPNFNLTHTQDNIILESLENQGMALPDFVYFQGIQGPIKIWEIKYTGEEQMRVEYIDTDPSKYLDWDL